MGLADFATVKSRDSRDFPGPGQYTPRSNFGKVRLEDITFKGRYKEGASLRSGVGSTNEQVGPGKYQIPPSPRGPQFTMAAPHPPDSHNASNSYATIGPSYSPRQYQMATDPHGPRYTFGAKTRGSGAVASDAPGPDYTLPSTLSPRSIKIAQPSGVNKEKEEPNPGPGAYAVPRFGDIVPKPKSVTQHKTQETEEKTPGPGAYQVDQHTIATKTTPRGPQKCVMGGRTFPPLPAPPGPGPAAYDVPSLAVDKTKGRTIGTKPPETSELEAVYPKPGPGDYNIPSTIGGHSGKGFSFGQKPPERTNRFPSPGPQDISVPQYSFTTELDRNPAGFRFSGRTKGFDKEGSSAEDEKGSGAGQWKIKKVDGPGPASYNPKPVGPSAPAFSLTPRDHKGLNVVERENVPGPGAYNIRPPQQKAGITFYKGSFEPAKLDNHVPGPGAYESANSYDKSVHVSKAVDFSLHSPPPQPSSSRRRNSP